MTHTLSGEVIPLSEEWERLPGMQRLITLDGVIYVHQNPKRRRRPVVREEAGAYAEPSADWSPEPQLVEEPEVAVAAVEAEFAGSADWSADSEEEAVAAFHSESETETDFGTEVLLTSEPEPEHVPEVEGLLTSDPDPTPESEPAPTPEPPGYWAPTPEPAPAPVAHAGANTRTIVRSTPVAPPPGYAVEFGTGRLVKIHSYKGRMSYPTSGW